MNYSLCNYIGDDGVTKNIHIIEYDTANNAILCNHHAEKHQHIYFLQDIKNSTNSDLFESLINDYNALRRDYTRGYLEEKKFRLLLAFLKNNNYDICGQCISTLY